MSFSMFARSKTSNAIHKSVRLYPDNEQMLSELTVLLGVQDASTIIRSAIVLLYEVAHMPRLYDLFWKVTQTGVLQPGRPGHFVAQGDLCGTNSSNPLKR